MTNNKKYPNHNSAMRSNLSIKHTTSNLPGPADIYREQISNGITVLCRSNFNSPSVVVSGYFPAGSLFDTDEKLGLANFAASALMRGTSKWDFQQLHEAIESIGASLGFSASVHTAGFTGRCLAEDLPLILEILAESLRQPAFPVKQIERLRAQLLTGLAIRNQNTAEMASLTFDQIVFAEHPYSRPEDGFPETVQSIARDDLVEFHRQHYGPGGMVIAVVGAVEPKGIIEQIQRVLGDWQKTDQPEAPLLPPVAMLKKTVTRHVTIAGKSQSDIVIGTVGPARRDQEFIPASLGNSILGQFGLMGRIGDIVRKKTGLAYYAYSNLSAGIGPGAWEVSAGVSPSNVEKAINLIQREISRFVEQGVIKEELSDSQANFIGRLPLSMESNAGVASALLNIERYDLGLDYYHRYADIVREVTPEEVQETARKFFDPKRLAIAIAGPS